MFCFKRHLLNLHTAKKMLPSIVAGGSSDVKNRMIEIEVERAIPQILEAITGRNGELLRCHFVTARNGPTLKLKSMKPTWVKIGYRSSSLQEYSNRFLLEIFHFFLSANFPSSNQNLQVSRDVVSPTLKDLA